MQEQNFKNHPRLVPEFHIIMFGIVLTVVILSVINLFHGITLSSSMFFLIGISSVIGFAKIRTFPVKVQDRAIRAEENLRCFTLTGKMFDKRLTINQIVALRFASDEEFVALMERAISENMSNKQIKLAIRNWRSDHHRA